MSSMIYADNAATTMLCEEAFEAMSPWFRERFANPSTLYRCGREAHKALENARRTIAKHIHADAMEVFFTSGGTESDNWALKGSMHHLAKQGKTHLITSAIEHHAVLNTAKSLEKEGFSVTYLPVGASGRVDPVLLQEALRPETGLVSVMYANNETGVIQPVDEIGAICREAGVLFHCDAVQVAGILPIDVKASKIDLLSMSAHKFHGPKGAGVLFARKKTIPDAYFNGGDQERGHRAGTENVPAIMGMTAAFELACHELDEKTRRLSELRDRVQAGLLRIPGSHPNGAQEHRLPGTLNISFENIDGQSLIMELDLRNICVSAGSACDSGSMTPSHVLLAMGVPYTLAHGSLRLSFGRYNDLAEADVLIQEITQAVELLRTQPPAMN